MKIQPIQININQTRTEKTGFCQNPALASVPDNGYSALSGAEIPFGALHGINPKKADVLGDKLKLEQAIANILNILAKNSIDNIKSEVFKTYASKLVKIFKRLLHEDKYMLTSGLKTQKEFVDGVCEKTKVAWEPVIASLNKDVNELHKQRTSSDKTDYELVNKLHRAVLSDDMNLDKIYKDYYRPLSVMTQVSDVRRVFPKFVLPPSAKENIGEKIAGILDKNFYTEFGSRCFGEEKDGGRKYFDTVFDGIIQTIAGKTKTDAGFLKEKLHKSTYKAVIERFHSINDTIGFDSYPEKMNIPKNFITKEEAALLAVDYDRFVLDVLKQLYFDGKKLSEVVYKEGNITISPRVLGNTDYKFEKPDEKIRAIVKQAEQIKRKERNYGVFTSDELKNRLKFYGNSGFANDEELLNKLIEFDSSQFVQGDRAPLIRFLEILDGINDGKIDIKEGVKIIKEENLHPHGTNRLNLAEKEQRINELKLEQKKNAEFRTYCDKFDRATDLLYGSGLEEAGVLVSSYRPKSAADSRAASDKIMQVIAGGVKDWKPVNSRKLEAELKYLNKYYTTGLYDSANPVFAAAKKYAAAPDGTIDEVKAGHYIAKSEAVAQYPASLSLFDENERDIISVICTRFQGEEAVKALMAFDNYRLLPENECLKITNILKYFDIAQNAKMKPVVYEILKNIYLPKTTVIETAINKDKTLMKNSEMLPSVKAAIFKDKMHPLCLEYFELFEKAMTRVGQFKEDDGIQVIGSNNKALRKLYKQEVKIAKDERLYSTEGDFRFDVYKPGLHKSKVTKA